MTGRRIAPAAPAARPYRDPCAVTDEEYIYEFPPQGRVTWLTAAVTRQPEGWEPAVEEEGVAEVVAGWVPTPPSHSGSQHTTTVVDEIPFYAFTASGSTAKTFLETDDRNTLKSK